MIVECENCHTKYNIDESRVKKEGSMVRCSLCKNIFIAQPPESAPFEKEEFSFKSQAEVKEDQEVDFEKLLDEPLEDIEPSDFVEAKKSDSEEPVSTAAESNEPAKGSPLIFILVIILAAIIGAAIAVRFWAPEMIPDSLWFLKSPEKEHVAPDMGGRHLSFKAAAGSFVICDSGKDCERGIS